MEIAITQELVLAPNGVCLGTVIGPCTWQSRHWLALTNKRIDGTGLLTNTETYWLTEQEAREHVANNGDQ